MAVNCDANAIVRINGIYRSFSPISRRIGHEEEYVCCVYRVLGSPVVRA